VHRDRDNLLRREMNEMAWMFNNWLLVTVVIALIAAPFDPAAVVRFGLFLLKVVILAVAALTVMKVSGR